ncbi:GNAT family N-acetyltransferase [Phycicoccus sp.]|uniref:GNAT family N-acetyltransferase n=1 Tax=Phycicoccus sp. TaxID=1902410 RepID=UPI002BD5DF1E|nr:GNAT family N-acetyltransferase [Phycicoccus sp.]HMM96803.1 GNAT family N-acetyltransferase [Phycicoccus sp.]
MTEILDALAPRLPAGFTARPLVPTDLDAAYHVYSSAQLEDSGIIALERADIEADWSRPSMDLSRDTVGVLREDGLVAAAEVSRGGSRAEAAVHPHHRGVGIGSWLASWVEERSRSGGAASVGQTVPRGSAGQRLLEGRGCREGHTSWVLELPPGAEVPDRPLPPGYRLRTAQSEADHRAAHDVIETAFGEWAGREREPFEEWAPGVVQRPGFEPWNLRVVEHDGTVVGACFTVVDERACGFVDQVAVAREHRGRGLAQALLADGFRNAREHGAVRGELSTDSRTGALDLYRKVGMRVSATWVHLVHDHEGVGDSGAPAS